jgi:hypothetical protein
VNISRLPASRHLDPRWNRALDLLTAAWNQAGPNAVIAALSPLTGDSAEQPRPAVSDIRREDFR